MTNDEYILQPFRSYFECNFPEFNIKDIPAIHREIINNGYSYIQGKNGAEEVHQGMVKLKEKLQFIAINEKILNESEPDIVKKFTQMRENIFK